MLIYVLVLTITINFMYIFLSVAILAQAQIAKMSHLHVLPGYVITEVDLDSVQTTMPFSLLFNACAALKDFKFRGRRDNEDVELAILCYHRNVREPIASIVCGFLGIQPPQAPNLITGEGGCGMTKLTWMLMGKIDDAWFAHVKDYAAFEGPSMANIAAVRMAGHLWLGWIWHPGMSRKPLTHWTYVDPPIPSPMDL